MAINRTPYNALVNDDGSNTVGSLWDKAIIATVLLDPIDAAIAAVPAATPSVFASTVTGAQHNYAPTLTASTLIPWAGPADAAFTGIAGGATGRVVTIKNTGAKIATFAHNSGSSSAGNKLKNWATSAPTPIAPGGALTYQYDGTDWQLIAHDQGDWITPAYAAGSYTASGSMTWTVDSGDVLTDAYYLRGRTLLRQVTLATTSVGGTVAGSLNRVIPGGFSCATEVDAPVLLTNPNATGKQTGFLYVPPGTAESYFVNLAQANWTLSTNLTSVIGEWFYKVT